jgi:hypothetical protein
MPCQTCSLNNNQDQLQGENVTNVEIICTVSPELIYQDGFEEP